jgi:ketosteroid isomerase-like protein
MHKFLIALAMSVLAVGPAAASTKTDVMSVVHQWADGFNKGDAKSIAGSCASQSSVIDDFPPHEWHGAGACSKWFDDFQTFAKAAEFAEPTIAIGKIWHIDVTGEVAYVVASATLTYQKKGSPAKLRATITAILKKGAVDWRITALTW